MLLEKIKTYSSFVKLSHTVFSFPFAVTGFFIAAYYNPSEINWSKLLYILLSVFFARNTALAFNRIVDRKYDKANPRTKNRDLPTNKISISEAILFTIINGLLFICITYFINFLCFQLSPVALVVILGYSYTKRFTYLSHFVLGIALSLAPIGAYLSVNEQFHFIPLLLSGAVLFWVAGFDIIYAINDIDFDKSAGLKSFPGKFGIKTSLVVSFISHIISTTFIVLVGYFIHGGMFFWIGTSIFFILILFHYHFYMRKQPNVKPFLFTINGIASVIFSVFFIIDYLLR